MKTYCLFICTAILLMVACKKKVEPPPPTKATIRSVMSQNAPAAQEFSINNETGGTITGAKGTVIIIAPNTYGNAPGTIRLTLKEITTPSEMAGEGIYTSAYGNQMLSTLGMFELKAHRNGTEVLPEKEAEIKMKIYSGSTPSNTRVFQLAKWYDANTGVNMDEWVEHYNNWVYDTAGPANTCRFSFKCISWCNLGSYIPLKFPDNHINITISQEFRTRKMDVYFKLDGINGLVKHYPQIADSTYNTYAIPLDYFGQIIILASGDDQFYVKMLNVEFVKTKQYITVSEMDDMNTEGLKNLLKNL